EESILKKLANDADETRGVLKDLYANRERLLKAELASLEKQSHLWKDANADLSNLLQQARTDIDSTLAGARTQLEQVGAAARTLAGELKEPLRRVTGVLELLATDSQKAGEATAKVRQSLEKAASDAVALRGAL